jgi:predicted nucleotidyltransferase
LDNQINEELKMLVDQIKAIVPVEQIFLFGSYVTGTPQVDSDLDIFVVINENATIREIDAMKLINMSIREIKTRPVDILVCKKNNFNVRKNIPSLERQIAQEGRVLYG